MKGFTRQDGVNFVPSPKQGNKIEDVVPNRVCILGILCSIKPGSGFQYVSYFSPGYTMLRPCYFLCLQGEFSTYDVTDIDLVPGDTRASINMADAGVGTDLLAEMQNAFLNNEKFLMAQNVVTQYDPLEVCLDRNVAETVNHVYKHKVI